MKNRTTLLSHFLMILTVLFWGNAFVGIKIALRDMTPLELTVLRFFLASLFFLIAVLLNFRRLPFPEKREFLRLVLLGLLGGVIYHVFLNFGEQYIPAGTASLIIGSSPIFTAILASVFLKEKLNITGISGVIVAFLGLFLVSWKGSGEELGVGSILGLLAVLGSSFSWALYPIFAKGIVSQKGSLFVSAYLQFFAFLILIPFSLKSFERIGSFSITSWIAVFFLAFFCTFLGYIFYNRALGSLGATVSSTYIYLVPVVALIFSWILLGESLNFLGVVGALLVILGVFLVNFGLKKASNSKREL
ncbi:MAG: DMT family transporter [bacterium]